MLSISSSSISTESVSAVPVDIVKAVEVRESSLSLVEEDVAAAVSYTHLDVYKRQMKNRSSNYG